MEFIIVLVLTVVPERQEPQKKFVLTHQMAFQFSLVQQHNVGQVLHRWFWHVSFQVKRTPIFDHRNSFADIL